MLWTSTGTGFGSTAAARKAVSERMKMFIGRRGGGRNPDLISTSILMFDRPLDDALEPLGFLWSTPFSRSSRRLEDPRNVRAAAYIAETETRMREVEGAAERTRSSAVHADSTNHGRR